jgi:replicative DNA helicase
MVHSCHLRRPPAVCGTFGRVLVRVSTVRARRQPAVSGFGAQSTRGAPGAQIGPVARENGWFRTVPGAPGARLCWHKRVDLSLEPLSGVLEAADHRVMAGSHPQARVWPTGFDLLDQTLSGGLRSGELVLLGGPQGLGKTTWVLQVARNTARSGRCALVFSFEHDLDTLLIRLVSLEAGQLGGIVAPNIARIRQSFEAMDGRTGSLADRLKDTEGGVEALEVVQEYSERLLLHRSTGTSTSIEVITAAIDQVKESTGQSPLVVVDYLQKVSAPQLEEYERITAVTEGLKDLALDHEVPILAVVASDKEGLASGKRMRVSNMRGSSALAYEADTVLLLNNKYDVVARHHLVYSMGNVEKFQNWAVLTVEKNRNGRSAVDLEFQKRFDQSRFETSGRQVVEQLVDERVFVE